MSVENKENFPLSVDCKTLIKELALYKEEEKKEREQKSDHNVWFLVTKRRCLEELMVVRSLIPKLNRLLGYRDSKSLEL